VKRIGTTQTFVYDDLSNWFNLAEYTLAADADVLADVVFTRGLFEDRPLDFRVTLDGMVVQNWPREAAEIQPGVTAGIFRLRLGPVASGTVVAIEGRQLGADCEGYVQLWAVDPMNALNRAMPPEKVAGSVLDDVRLARAALVNRRTHDVPTAVNTIYDNDGATELVTLTPDESNGVVTITPS